MSHLPNRSSWIVAVSVLGCAIGLAACGSSSPSSTSSTTSTAVTTTTTSPQASGATGASSTTLPSTGATGATTGTTGAATGTTGTTATGGTGLSGAEGDNLLWHVTVTYSGGESGTESFNAGTLLQNEQTAQYFDCDYAASHTNSSQYVGDAQAEFVVPDDPGEDFEPIGGPTRTIDVLFTEDMYAGPGTYTSANTNQAANMEVGAKDLGSGDFTYSVSPPVGSWKLVVNADASGTFTFSGAKPATQFGSTATGTLSGTVTWTCENINPHP